MYLLVERICKIVFLIIVVPSFCFSEEHGKESSHLSGLIQSSYRGYVLNKGLGDNHKFLQSLDISYDDSEQQGVSFDFSGDLIFGDNTHQDESTGSIFDTWHQSAHTSIYQLSSDVVFFKPTCLFSVGRHFVENLFKAHIDGISLSNKFSNGLIYIYAGIPVRFYDDDLFTDSKQAGTSLSFYLNSQTSLNMAYQYLKEVPDIFENGSPESIHQLALSVNQSIQDMGTFYLMGKTINSDMDQIKANILLFLEQHDVSANFTGLYQLKKISERPVTEAYFAGVMGTILPYYYLDINVNKFFSTYNFEIYGGLASRKLENDSLASEFNHSFIHEYVGLILHDVTSADLYVHFKGDLWHQTQEGKNDFATGGFDITYDQQGLWRLETGLNYSLYRYDYYMDLNEKDDIYSIYAEARLKNFFQTEINIRYHLDMYDLTEHRFNITAKYYF
ncbi:MAG: hypothetical protein HQK75_14490 [Candidatus Magnetomorum sp.]|nr:hypothetical protein [Candidatus Magnetomorum sp.]